MGLLDSVAGAVLGKVMGGNQGGMAAIAMELLNGNGGIGGLLEKFNQGGLGDLAASWVGKGENLPISAEQITSALGNGQLAEIASKFGISPEVLSSQLAEHLPSVIDKVTPDGAVTEESGNILTSILGMLK
ncbi:MAG TPA: YidB family protein [Methylotenera sp.]|nr:YidB family protein [Methylotenera sp.]HPH04591.1 YidB family protein [Methylotenera sp.]HPN00734.1 YidB family protein [Methylotenera sp.]